MGNYYNEKESVNEYINMAKGINGKELIDAFATFLPINSLLLEIGSGPGSDYQILSERFTVIGSDNSQEFLKHLQSSYPAGKFLNLDASTLLINDKIDGIYSNKVLIHLHEAELIQSIKRQSEILNEGGVVCHSFWKGEGDEIFKGLYVNYMTEGELNKLFEPYFESLQIIHYAEFEPDDSICFIGRKKKS